MVHGVGRRVVWYLGLIQSAVFVFCGLRIQGLRFMTGVYDSCALGDHWHMQAESRGGGQSTWFAGCMHAL